MTPFESSTNHMESNLIEAAVPAIPAPGDNPFAPSAPAMPYKPQEEPQNPSSALSHTDPVHFNNEPSPYRAEPAQTNIFDEPGPQSVSSGKAPSQKVGLWGVLLACSLLLMVLSARICDCADGSCSVWGDYNGVSSCSGTIIFVLLVSLSSTGLCGMMVANSVMRHPTIHSSTTVCNCCTGCTALSRGWQAISLAVFILWTGGTGVATFR